MRTKFLYYLLILLLPIQLGKHFWPPFAFVSGIRVDYLAPTIYLTDILILGIFLSWFFEKIGFLQITNYKLLITKNKFFALFFLLLIVNIIFAHNKSLAFFKSLKIIEFSLLALYIIKEKPSLKITVYCLLFTVCYSCLITWGQFIKQSSLNGILYFLGERTFNISTPGIARVDIFGRLILRPYATFPHPNVLAGFLTVVLPFLIFLPQILKVKIQKLTFFFPLLFLTFATIFITFSRTAWIVSILIISFTIFEKLKSKKCLAFFFLFSIFYFLPACNACRPDSASLWQAGASITGRFSIFQIFTNRLQSVFTTDQESFLIRQKLTLVSLQMIKANQVFGVGLNNFIPQISSHTTINSYQELQPVHNIYLLITAEGGIVGLIIFVVLTIKTVQKIFNKSLITNYQLPITISFFSILIISLFDHYFFTLQQTQLLFTVILGFIFSYKESKIKV